jgi:hypothetical protein
VVLELSNLPAEKLGVLHSGDSISSHRREIVSGARISEPLPAI